MPMKDLLILARTIPEILKVFDQLSLKFDTDERKGKNNTLRFPIKNHDCVAQCYARKCNAASTCARGKEDIENEKRDVIFITVRKVVTIPRSSCCL